MKKSHRTWLWMAPMLAFLAGVVAAASDRASVPAATPVAIVGPTQDAIDCKAHAPIQFEFVALDVLEQQAREPGSVDVQRAGQAF